MEGQIRKPEIGERVYCIYDDYNILAEEVYAIGEDTFLLYFHDRVEDAIEYYYEDYKITWFYSEQSALEQIERNCKEDMDEGEEMVVVQWPHYLPNQENSFYYEAQSWDEDLTEEDYGGKIVYRIK